MEEKRRKRVVRAVWSPANRGSGQSLRQLPSGTASFCILNRTFDLSAARMYVHKCFFRLRKVEMRIMIKLEKIKLPFIRTKIISQFVQFYEYLNG